MEKNIGKTDKTIRIIISLIIIYIGLVYNWWFLILALALLFTVIMGFCWPYKLLGVNTCKKG